MSMSSMANMVVFEFITLITSLEVITFHGSYYYDSLCFGKVHVTGISTANAAGRSFNSVLRLCFSLERG